MRGRRLVTVREAYKILRSLNGKGYGAYAVLRGIEIDFDGAIARFTKVQGDPHATPSILEVNVPEGVHRFPDEFFEGSKSVPFADYLARKLFNECRKVSRKRGSGYSGYVGVPRPGPWVLRRSCVEVCSDGSIKIRVFVGLPARGRRILGDVAAELVCRDVYGVVKRVLGTVSEVDSIRRHVVNYLDQEFIREWLSRNGYMFFVGDGSILPRESAISDRPMKGAVPFKSPDTLRITLTLPSGRAVSGMAVPLGVLVVTGGGYHGKTTLLEALQDGIYPHVEGDGRELVVSRKLTVLVKAEDGRIVSCVDISTFIRSLPGGADTTKFSTLDASGSTSMAASINEAVEAGAEVLLIDEDTSATNLLFKDDVMAKVVKEDPIRQLSSQVRDMVKKLGTGLVVVASASSAFIPQADKIVLMERYVPKDITEEAKKLVKGVTYHESYIPPRKRVFKGVEGVKKVKAKGWRIVVQYTDGKTFELDLSDNPRIVESGQVRMVALAIRKLTKPKRHMTATEIIEYINEMFEKGGFEAFAKPVPPDLTEVHGFDVVWALNRLYRAVFDQA